MGINIAIRYKSDIDERIPATPMVVPSEPSEDVQRLSDKSILITHASMESLGKGMVPVPTP